jgi:signal peptidase I
LHLSKKRGILPMFNPYFLININMLQNLDEKNEENQNVDSQKEAYYGVGSFIIEVIKVFFWAVIIILPIRLFLFQPFFVQGASMEPNFDDGQYLIVNELGYKETSFDLGGNHLFSFEPFKELSRGDVIVFRYPKNPSQFFIKRVIGLPGETVSIKDGQIMIANEKNPTGFILDESSYLPMDLKTSGEMTRKLEGNQYFVLGDNRGASHDSRAWGPLPKNLVIGKVTLRAWPLAKTAVY